MWSSTSTRAVPPDHILCLGLPSLQPQILPQSTNQTQRPMAKWSQQQPHFAAPIAFMNFLVPVIKKKNTRKSI